MTYWTNSRFEVSLGKPSASASRPRLPSPLVKSFVQRAFS
jgi:hypothetical protein